MEFRRSIAAILVVFIFTTFQSTSIAQENVESASIWIAIYDANGEILTMDRGIPFYIEGIGTSIVATSEIAETENSVYATAIYYDETTIIAEEEIQIIVYEPEYGICIFLMMEDTGFQTKFELGTLEEELELGQVCISGEGETYIETTEVEAYEAPFYKMDEVFSDAKPGLPVIRMDTEEIVGIVVNSEQWNYMLSMGDVLNVYVATLQAVEESSSSGDSGVADSTAENASGGGLFSGTSLWGMIVLILAVAVGVCIYSLSKKKKTDGYVDVDEGMPVLLGVSGIHIGNEFPLDQSIYMGRDTKVCNIIFTADTRGISSRHCQITVVNGVVQVTDLGSTYGTFLDNGTKLTPNMPYVLNRGDGFYLADRSYSYTIK